MRLRERASQKAGSTKWTTRATWEIPQSVSLESPVLVSVSLDSLVLVSFVLVCRCLEFVVLLVSSLSRRCLGGDVRVLWRG